jgi:hypothetical protein
MESNKKYPFDIKFEESLKKALLGYAPWKDGFKFKSKKDTTDPQKHLLKTLGYTGKIPKLASDTSILITQLKKV